MIISICTLSLLQSKRRFVNTLKINLAYQINYKKVSCYREHAQHHMLFETSFLSFGITADAEARMTAHSQR